MDNSGANCGGGGGRIHCDLNTTIDGICSIVCHNLPIMLSISMIQPSLGGVDGYVSGDLIDVGGPARLL